MHKTKNILYSLILVLFLFGGVSVYATENQQLDYIAQPAGPDSSLLGGNADGSPNNSAVPANNSSATADAEAADAALAETVKDVETAPDSQAAAYTKGEQSGESSKIQAVKTAAAEGLGCSAGQILGNILGSLISGAIGAGVSAIVDFVAGGIPVHEDGRLLVNSSVSTSAETGTAVGVWGIGALVLPSWNSIAYCVANAMITYVANSTIAWVQGGFEGNPSFVNNPEQFFKDLANIEAGAFLQELAYGVTGLNICEPFRIQIVLTIARNHVGGQQGYGGSSGYSRGGFGGGKSSGGYGGCTLDDIQGNLEGFLRGDFQKGGWSNWFQISQVDSNNPYATYFNLQAQLNGAVNKQANLARVELDWGKGFLSFRKCDEKVPKSEQSKCPITTPGNVIQGQLEKTLGLSKDRLVLAEKFDQVIAAVVNQLISTALNKVLDVIVQ
jgi:hypothetical protein